MSNQRFDPTDKSFYLLAEEVTKILDKNSTFKITQKEEVEKLMAMEEDFREEIGRFSQSYDVYSRFVMMIVGENRSILSARPYFRARAKTFSASITPCIKNGDIDGLKKFHINMMMIEFIKNTWKGKMSPRAESLYSKIKLHRNRLIENNIPLAIYQAKIFFKKTPQAHLEMMDMISLCAAGLASAVDKWCGEYRTVFRSSCIGRMKGNLIDEYSDTMLHFYPNDRKILYKANAIRYREKIEDVEKLAEAVSKAFAEDEMEKPIEKRKKALKVTPAELRLLLWASSMMSADTSATDDESYNVYNTTSDTSSDVEDKLIVNETLVKASEVAKDLSVIQRKVLKMKGLIE